MKSRIMMFSVLAVLFASLFVSNLPAEPPTQPEAVVVCQTLAPPLPAAATDQAAGKATADKDEDAVDGLTWRERRKLGLTRMNVARVTIRLSRQGELPSTAGLSGEDLDAARAEIKDAVSAEIMAENPEAWAELIQSKTVQDDDGRNWAEFLDALASFFERLMPLIEQLMEWFGTFAHNAIPTPTTGVADCVPVVSPLLSLAA